MSTPIHFNVVSSTPTPLAWNRLNAIQFQSLCVVPENIHAHPKEG